MFSSFVEKCNLLFSIFFFFNTERSVLKIKLVSHPVKTVGLINKK